MLEVHSLQTYIGDVQSLERRIAAYNDALQRLTTEEHPSPTFYLIEQWGVLDTQKVKLENELEELLNTNLMEVPGDAKSS